MAEGVEGIRLINEGDIQMKKQEQKKVAVKCRWLWDVPDRAFVDCNREQWSPTYVGNNPRESGYNFCPTCGRKINFAFKGEMK